VLRLKMALAPDETKDKIIEGRPIVYERESNLIAEQGKVFKEIIKRGALTKVLESKPDIPLSATWFSQAPLKLLPASMNLGLGVCKLWVRAPPWKFTGEDSEKPGRDCPCACGFV
jgi:hypothetical protein